MPVVIASNTPVSLAQTLGSILTSLVDAQAQSARTTVDFVNEVGFLTDPADQKERLRTVQFKYHKLDENGVRSEFLVEIPFLGMMEIPMLSIRKARIEFDYDVTSTAVESGTQAGATGPQKKPDRAIFKGMVSRRAPADGSQRASLKVVVEIERSDLPIGLEKALTILEVAASEAKHVPT
jgi:hypothetical protein